MNRIEPSLGSTYVENSQTAFSETAASAFSIALCLRPQRVRGDWKARSFNSKGIIRFQGDQVLINTSSSHLLRKNTETVLNFNRNEIFNIECNGTLVCFEFANQAGTYQPIVLKAHTKREATSIAALLPQQMTASFAAENQQRVLFLRSITEQTPRIWITWTLIALNVVAFIVMVKGGAGLIKSNNAVVTAYGSNYAPATLNGQGWRLLTSTFIHFGLFHIAFNMLVLGLTGRIVGRLFGNARFLALYLFAGLTGSLVSLLWHPVANSAGASGAIFGVLGALLAYVIRYRGTIPKSIYMQHLRMATVFIVYNLAFGFTHQRIDNGAHLGGLFGGLLLGWLLARPPQLREARAADTWGIATSTLVGLATLGVLTAATINLDSTPQRRYALQFAVALRSIGVVERQAVADLRKLPLKPETQQDRALLSNRIRNDVLPEWNRLYDSLYNTPTLEDSPQSRVKSGLLRYYDDVRQMLQLTADAAYDNKMHDPTIVSAIKNLTADARRQSAAVKTQAAHS